MYRRMQFGLVAWTLMAAWACGGDSGSSDQGACTSDVHCKGDRVCESGVCVDPKGAADSGSGSGSGGDSGSGGTGGDGPPYSGGSRAGNGAIDDPELEQACGLECEARQAAACPMNPGSLDQCLAQCLVIDESTQGYCLEEMTARYACSASGGFTCVSGYAQPKSTCIAESTALSQCSQMIPCWSYCDKLPADCSDAGDGCFDTCTQQQGQFEDAICGIYYNQLLSCWSRGVTCADGKPTVGSCGPAIAEVADCVGRRNHDCDGFCWAAETMGCGSSDCVSTCKAKYDAPTCGSYYRNVLDCAISSSRELNLSCEDGQPTIDATACMTYIQQYESCAMTQ